MLGVRVRYRIYFDEVLADYDHAWEYVATGAPVPRLERDMLAAVVIGPGTPLQLRSGGVFRGMVAERDADAVRAAIEELGGDVTAAAGKIAGVKAVQEVLARILDGGAAHVLGMPAHEACGRGRVRRRRRHGRHPAAPAAAHPGPGRGRAAAAAGARLHREGRARGRRGDDGRRHHRRRRPRRRLR